LKLGYKNRYLKTAVIAGSTFLVFCISIIINYNNEHLSRDWQHSNSRNIIIKEVIADGIFDKIPDDAIIYMNNFNQTSSQFGHHLYSQHRDFFATYIHVKTGRKLNIDVNYEDFKDRIQANPLQEVYYITKYETQKSLDILFVLSKVNVNSIDFENEETTFASASANEAIVCYYSANKNFTFQFVIPQHNSALKVMINDAEIQNISAGINAVQIENTNKRKAVTSFTLKSEDPFLVKDFAVSNMGFMSSDTVQLYDY
jgi:hypothetical protein